jgi:hypothetical protein
MLNANAIAKTEQMIAPKAGKLSIVKTQQPAKDKKDKKKK